MEWRLLTGSDNSSTARAGLSTTSTKGQDVAKPSKGHLAAVTVEVRHKCAGSLELAQLAIVRRVANGKKALQPARAGGDGPTVDPNVEAGSATVGTASTLTNTTEGEGWDVQSSIVNGDTTGTCGVQD